MAQPQYLQEVEPPHKERRRPDLKQSPTQKTLKERGYPTAVWCLHQVRTKLILEELEMLFFSSSSLSLR